MHPQDSPEQNFDVDYSEESLGAYEDDSMIRFVLDRRKDENFFPLRGHRETASISGRGSAKEDCGQYTSHWMTDDHAEIKHKRKNCHLQGCPICFRIFAEQRARTSSGYLYGFVTSFGKALGHWTFSTRKFRGWRHLDRALLAYISDWTNQPDSTVIAVTRHPRRVKCNTPGCDYEPLVHCIKGHGPCPKCGLLNWVWAWGPHLHVITSFYFNPGPKTTQFPKGEWAHRLGVYMKQRGWFAKLITPITSQDVLKSVLRYEFGHALWKPTGSPVIRYLGFCAKNHFRVEIKKHHSPVLSEKTQQPFYKLEDRFIDFGHLDDPENPCEFIQINKYILDGSHRVEFVKDLFGKRIMLTETEYVYKLEQLGQYINGRWLRFTLPRQTKLIKRHFKPQKIKRKLLHRKSTCKNPTIQSRLDAPIIRFIRPDPSYSIQIAMEMF